MNESDFFVGLAEVAGTLLGTFLVGLFFYLDLDARRERVADNRYLRAGVLSVFVLYAIPVFVPIAFIAVGTAWATLLFAALSLLLLATVVATVRLILSRRGSRQSVTLVLNEWAGIPAVIVLIALPWLTGGFAPQPENFNASLLIALLVGFLNTVTLIMNEFDAKRSARTEESESGGHD